MPLVMRPLIAVCLLSFASGSFAAKKKPAAPPAPTAPAAYADFYSHVNYGWLQSHPLPPGSKDQLAIWR